MHRRRPGAVCVPSRSESAGWQLRVQYLTCAFTTGHGQTSQAEQSHLYEQTGLIPIDVFVRDLVTLEPNKMFQDQCTISAAPGERTPRVGPAGSSVPAADPVISVEPWFFIVGPVWGSAVGCIG